MKKGRLIQFNRCMAFCLALCLSLVPFESVLAGENESSDGTGQTGGDPAPGRGVTINVYNWGEYIANGTDGSPDLNEEFTRRTGIQVNYTTFDSNEALYSKLAGGGADYDVIIPSDYMVSKLIDENMLAELDYSNIPNFQYIDKRFRDPDYDPGAVIRYPIPGVWWDYFTIRTI